MYSVPWWTGGEEARRDLILLLRAAFTALGRSTMVTGSLVVDCESGYAYTVVGSPGNVWVVGYGRFGVCGGRVEVDVRYCARLYGRSPFAWEDFKAVIESLAEAGLVSGWEVSGVGCVSGTYAGRVCGALTRLEGPSGGGCLVVGYSEDGGRVLVCGSENCGDSELIAEAGYEEAIALSQI